MPWTVLNNKLVNENGDSLDLWPQDYWYVAPARTSYRRGEGVVRPLEFAFLLHNAVKGEGLVNCLDVLLEGIEPRTSKRGSGADAENLLESIRQRDFSNLPSRLRSYYLNYDKTTAEFRQKSMFRGQRLLVRCNLVRNGGRYHFADIDIYERLEGQPESESLAAKYWETFTPNDDIGLSRLEVLADSALYFPDWRTFPTLDDHALMLWSFDNPPHTQPEGDG